MARVKQDHLDLILDQPAFFLDDKDDVQVFSERANSCWIERPGHPQLAQPHAHPGRLLLTQTQVGQRLADIQDKPCRR